MNTNKDAKVILCFGDSNTWGRNPIDSSRFNSSQRWTGKLQDGLGKNFYIIEEGLGGRTTDCENPGREGRDGFLYFKPCIESHEPDIVVLMLGTNDLKDFIDKSADDIVLSLESYCQHIQVLDKRPSLILVSPTSLNMDAPEFMHKDQFSEASGEKASELPAKIEALARKYICEFLNASDFAELGNDGLHWTEDSHNKFGEEVVQKVRGLA